MANATGGHFFGKRSHMYSVWHPIELHRNRFILLISRKPSDLEGDHITARAKTLSDIKEIVARKNGKVTGLYYYRFLKEGPESPAE